MAATVDKSVPPYDAYLRRDVPQEDVELTHVGPGTPCGEYLRRFWHPVGLSADLKDLPKAVRILGEDLVLFRSGEGDVGLLQPHCSHRGTSLEFGTVERCGIRCCWSSVPPNISETRSNSGFDQLPRLNPTQRFSARGVLTVAYCASVSSPSGMLMVMRLGNDVRACWS